MLVSGYNSSAQTAGIYIYKIDERTGAVTETGSVAGVSSPSYCQSTPDKLYAASETATHGGLAAYSMKNGSQPALVDQVAFKDAAGTCFVLAHNHPSRYIYGADYNSGSVCMATLDERGAIEDDVKIIQHGGQSAPRKPSDPHADRQLSPHVHTLSFVPHTHLIAAVDLGLDLLVLYQTDADGQIREATGNLVLNEHPDSMTELTELSEDPANARAGIRLTRTLPGNGGRATAELPIKPAALVEVPLHYGPRIVTYHPNKTLAALICELGCKVLLYKISENGLVWTLLEEHDLIDGAPNIGKDGKPSLSAHCVFSNDERFLYTSTRGTDQLTVFSVDGDHLERLQVCSCGGDTPRHFALSPDNALLAVANQTSDNVSLFRRNNITGKLDMFGSIPCDIHPSCIVWE